MAENFRCECGLRDTSVLNCNAGLNGHVSFVGDCWLVNFSRVGDCRLVDTQIGGALDLILNLKLILDLILDLVLDLILDLILNRILNLIPNLKAGF